MSGTASQLARFVRVCLMVGLVVACNPPTESEPADLADSGVMMPDGGEDLSDVAVPPLDDMGVPALCDPDPYLPARPLWSEITNPNDYFTGPYPDYVNISNNFTVIDSLQLLISIFPRASKNHVAQIGRPCRPPRGGP